MERSLKKNGFYLIALFLGVTWIANNLRSNIHRKEIVTPPNVATVTKGPTSFSAPDDSDVTEIKTREFNQARKQLEESIQEYPRSWEAYEALGNLLLEQGLPINAIEVATNCLNVDGEAPYCHDILIKSYEMLGDEAQMFSAINECRHVRSDFFCIQKARDYFLAQGDMLGAREVVEQDLVGEIAAEQQEILSRFYRFTGEHDKSMLALKRACDLGDQESCGAIEKSGQ